MTPPLPLLCSIDTPKKYKTCFRPCTSPRTIPSTYTNPWAICYRSPAFSGQDGDCVAASKTPAAARKNGSGATEERRTNTEDQSGLCQIPTTSKEPPLSAQN